MKWTIETLNTLVDDELEALHPKLKAKFLHIAALLEKLGLGKSKNPM